MPDASDYPWEDDAKNSYALWISINRTRFAPPLCECGQPLRTIDEGGHVKTRCCGRILEGCCGDI